MSAGSPYSLTYGLKEVPFQATGQLMDPKYRVVLPKSAKSLLDEMNRVWELRQTELVIVRGVVGSGKTRLLTSICNMIRDRSFDLVGGMDTSVTSQPFLSLKQRKGFGFNVELDKLNTLAFEKRFHDAVVDFLPEGSRDRFSAIYDQRLKQSKKRYASKTKIARKLVSEMVSILASEFGYEYFLICIDEFDIILPEQRGGHDYATDVVEFLNGLNEVSKDLSNMRCPILIALLQTHYANKYFHDYIKRLSDATGSRISTRFDVVLGYEYKEVREFVRSRLEPERTREVSDPLTPFSDEVIGLLYEQFEDKGEKKVLSLRLFEQALLKLLEMGLQRHGTITVEMAQQVASELTPLTDETSAQAIPPEIVIQARRDLEGKPIEKASKLKQAVESYLDRSSALQERYSDVAEPVELTGDAAIIRAFYGLVYANNSYDVAILYCVHRSHVTTRIQEIVDATLRCKPQPHRVIALVHSPVAALTELSGAELISIKTRDLELMFSALHMPEVPDEVNRQISFTLGRIASAVAQVRDIPKALKIPAYCVNTAFAVVIAHVKGRSTIVEIGDALELVFGKRYDRNLSEYLSRLRDWGLVQSEGETWMPLVPSSLQTILSLAEGTPISRDELEVAFPRKRHENVETLAMCMGFLVEEDDRLVRKGLDFWESKFGDSTEKAEQYGQHDTKEVQEARHLAEVADNVYDYWSQVALKAAVGLDERAVSPVIDSQKEREVSLRKLNELRQDVEGMKPHSKHEDTIRKELISRIDKAKESPEAPDIDQLTDMYNGLVGLEGETSLGSSGLQGALRPTRADELARQGPIEQEILRILSDKPTGLEDILKQLPRYSEDVVKTILMGLIEEGKVSLTRGQVNDESQ